ncbi:MAG TPA: tyrosine-type recombinase/integrase [Steroidobacteraceae bacterium]|jgi:integrase|nr:tyrosine-type recombinase/integrase [Steroidobacteraceae bacterium]
MGNQKTSGLTKRGGIWHIDKQFRGVRIRESASTSNLTEAVALLAKRIEAIRKTLIYGVRPERTFRAAATKYLQENQHKRSISDDAGHLAILDPFIGDMFLSGVYMEKLQPFIDKRRKDGVKTKTINLSLEAVRRILRLAALEWRDERGMTWLETAPKIKLFPVTDARKPHSLSVEEQEVLFRELPVHLLRMASYKVNAGNREEEVCSLKWAWEQKVADLETSVFVIPGDKVKNAEDRLVVLNRVARSAIEAARGMHPEYVFVRQEKDGRSIPIKKMYGTAWKNARERAADAWERSHGTAAPQGFRRVRVHDLKHTFGRRLRAAGVSFEDRQDLLGHKSRRITTHYSEAELENLITAAEKACDLKSRRTPAISWASGATGSRVETNALI